MDKKNALSSRQLTCLLWAGMLAPLVRQAPAAMLGPVGRGVWVSALLTLPAAALLSLLAGLFLRARAPGEGPGGLLRRVLGPGPARFFGILAGLWLCFCAGFTLRAGADRMVAAVYPESPTALFGAMMLALCLPAALGELRTLGRMAELTGPLLLGLVALVLLLAAPNIDPASLRPDAAELRGAPAGALPLLGTVSAGAFFLVLWGDGETDRPARLFLPALAGLSLTALGLCAAVTGTFGPELAGEMSYSFFVMLRNIQLPHLLERGEALVAAGWVISDYLLTAAQLHMASQALAPGRPESKRKRAVWLAGGLAALAAALCAPDAFALQSLGRKLIPAVDLAAAFGLLPLLLLIGRLRGKN